VNDADFEMLANQCEGAYEQWLRVQALTISMQGTIAGGAEDTLARAERFYRFLRGDASPMDER
jgi:hypothetical protein